MVNRTDVNRNTRRQPHWNGKNPAQIPDAAPRSRTALDPVAYDNLIKQHGVRVKVYRSMFCPNVKSVDGGEHNIDCTLCNGSGYLDVDPIESVAYLANQNFQEEMTVEGYHDGNTVGATFLGGVELQYFTRVDLMDFTQPFYERVLRRNGVIFPAPEVPAVIGVNSSFSIQYPEAVNNNDHVIFTTSALGADSFFEQISGTTATELLIGTVEFGSQGTPTAGNYDTLSSGSTFQLGIRPGPVNNTGNILVGDLINRINAISTDRDNPTEFFTRNVTPGTPSATVIRNCTASLDPLDNRNIIFTRLTNGPVSVVGTPSETDVIFTIRDVGVTPVTFVPEIFADNIQDNLKYDCRRVNVIIDKTGTQYYQDIDFVLTAQGNIQWLENRRRPAETTIYTVHYESVIQYRTLTAMHINRFAQVPDRSTGLVAQVKMPEQWMMQKEFLIRRRDQFGNEIAATGIVGDVIAAQPLNPAPADTLTP